MFKIYFLSHKKYISFPRPDIGRICKGAFGESHLELSPCTGDSTVPAVAYPPRLTKNILRI